MADALRYGGRYRVAGILDKGGKRNVFLAYDEKLEIWRVIKEIRFSQGSQGEEMRQKALAEIHILKELQHPCIPQITDVFLEEEAVLIVMEKIEGESLQSYIERTGNIDVDKVVEWGIRLGQILRYLHHRNPPVIHRDLKPRNVILHPSGMLYLIDFGIAAIRAENFREMDSRGTFFGESLQGTHGFAAPEQYSGETTTDERTDIYGLGKSMIYCLGAGKNPVSHRRTCISESLFAILRKCTEERPEDRYQKAEDLLEALYGLQKGQRRTDSRKHMKPQRVFPLVILFLACILAFRCAGRVRGEMQASDLLDRAEESPGGSRQLDYYRNALAKAPWKEEIYQSICEIYIRPNHFSSGEAAQILNLLQDTGALPILKRQNPEAYSRFCYGMGIGYFYQMGGLNGKREARIWFSRAIDPGPGLTEARRKRAECYRDIGDYYHTFLSCGKDENSEHPAGSYTDFFRLLQNLRVYSTAHGNSNKEDQSAVWYAAYEVAAEIRDFAEHFLKEPDITEEMLLKELEAIEISAEERTDEPDHVMDEEEKEKRDQLVAMVADAKNKIQRMEANYDKEKDHSVADTSDVVISGAAGRPDGRNEQP